MSTTPGTNPIPADLSPKWRERFAFFDTYGPLNRPEAKAAYKLLPMGKKMLINMSWLGLFFGGIYWLVLGMPKRALAWFALAIGSVVLVGVFEGMTGIKVPALVVRALTLGLGLLSAQATNYAYYLKVVKGDNGWNPFRGLRL